MDITMVYSSQSQELCALIFALKKDLASPIQQVTNESCWKYCVSHVLRCHN